MFAQDVMDLAREDPSLFPGLALAVLAFGGTGIQTFNVDAPLKELSQMAQREGTGVSKKTVKLLSDQVKTAETMENEEEKKAELERINRVAATMVKEERERRRKNRKGTEFDRRVKQGKELIESAKEKLK